MPAQETTLDVERNGGPYLATVDTNVLLEFYTCVDVDRAAAGGRGLASRVDRKRGTLWLAMCFDALRASTLSLHIEARDQTLRLAPRGSAAAEWPNIVTHLVHDYVTPGWNAVISSRDATTVGEATDTVLVEMAAQHHLPLISRDQRSLRRKAERAGVSQYTPEEFAATLGFSYGEARDRFFQRYDAGVLPYLADVLRRFGPFGPCHEVRDALLEMHLRAAANVRELYWYFWDETAEWPT